MQLKLGEKYLTRGGDKVRIIEINRGKIYGEIGTGYAAMKVCYQLDGWVSPYPGPCTPRSQSPYDVISEVPVVETSRPEMTFSFRLPQPHYSLTITETKLRQEIDAAKNGVFCDAQVLALAAERMIEQAWPPKPISLPRLNPGISIRRQIAEMLEAIGLEPNRFLNDPDKDIKPMCGPTKSPAADRKQVAEQAAAELAQLMHQDLGVSIPAILLRLWLVERWDKVAELAHKIHGSA